MRAHRQVSIATSYKGGSKEGVTPRSMLRNANSLNATSRDSHVPVLHRQWAALVKDWVLPLANPLGTAEPSPVDALFATTSMVRAFLA